MTLDPQSLLQLEAEADRLDKLQARKRSSLEEWKSLKPTKAGERKTDRGMRLFNTIASLGHQINSTEKRITALLNQLEGTTTNEYNHDKHELHDQG